MLKKLMIILIIGLSIVRNSAFAQSDQSIEGAVQDVDHKAFGQATVILKSKIDSSVLKTVFTNKDGKFSFQNVSSGNYFVQISSLGYLTHDSEMISLSGNGKAFQLPLVMLISSVNKLKEVSITSTKTFVEKKIDRTIINVDALISNAGTTALEVLEKSPGVTIDQSGLISLMGKQDVNVYIDDKPSYLSGADLQAYLQSMPSSTIEVIELMTNPPARYDASGNAGIINIKTKKGKFKGFNGALNLGITQGQLTRSNNSLNFNARDQKLNLFGTLGYSLLNSFSDLDINRIYRSESGSIKSFFDQNSYIRRHGNNENGKLGLDYYLSEHTTWGIVLTGSNRSSSSLNSNKSLLLNPASVLDSTLVSKSNEAVNFKNLGLNTNFRHQFDTKGQEITVDGDFLHYTDNTVQAFDNFSYDNLNSLKYNDLLSGNLPTDLKIYSLKADYTFKPLNGWKLSSGLKTSFTKTDNLATYETTTQGVTNPDYEKSNHFVYKENINAGYLNASRETKHLSVQVGLRFEQTTSDGYQYGNLLKSDSSFKRNYTSLFPTLYLSYKLDTLSKNQLSFNYGKRIDRPFYEDLNPFVAPLDKFTYYLGNPYLKPSYTQSIELSHSYKSIFTTTLSYSNTKNQVDETIEIVDGTYFSKPNNIGKTTLKSLSVDGNFDFTKWLNVHLFVQVAQTHSISDFYTGKLNTKGVFYHINPTFQIKFSQSWSGEVSGFYQSKVVNAQFVSGAVKQVRAAIMKKLSTNINVKLTANDLFYTRVNSGIINNLALTDAKYRNVGDSRSGTLTLSYRFGKTLLNVRNHELTGAESEQNRVKN
jgi:hypothetical protein